MAPRVGFGFDVHRLKDGEPFFLGGVKVEHSKGAVGHSDGDTVIHAICDALLGAANLGDIGSLFPSGDEKYKDIDSKVLLKEVAERIGKQGFKINNVDVTISLQEPMINSYIPAMKAALADAISLPEDLISIKATTTDRLGYIGKEEGVAAYAVAMLDEN